MSTRSGVPYHPHHSQSSEPMENEREDQLKVIIEQLARMNSKLDKFEDRFEARKAHAKFNSSRPNSLDPRAYDHDLAPESSPRSPYPYLVDSEEGPIRSTEPYAPTFDGRQEAYIDWEE